MGQQVRSMACGGYLSFAPRLGGVVRLASQLAAQLPRACPKTASEVSFFMRIHCPWAQ